MATKVTSTTATTTTPLVLMLLMFLMTWLFILLPTAQASLWWSSSSKKNGVNAAASRRRSTTRSPLPNVKSSSNNDGDGDGAIENDVSRSLLGQQDSTSTSSRPTSIVVGGRASTGNRLAGGGGAKKRRFWHRPTSTTIEFLDRRLPKLRIRVEPTTTVKLKKRFAWRRYKFWIAADYHVQENLWRFQTSLAGDNNAGPSSLLGGGAVLVLAGRELQYHRVWDIQLLPDLYTCLRLRTAVDVLNGQASVKIGFGSSVLQAVDLQKGLTVRHQFPLDQAQQQPQPPTMGNNNIINNKRESRVKLEVAASLALPDTALEFSTPGFRRRAHDEDYNAGGGAVTTATVSDIRVALDEVNLVLDY